MSKPLALLALPFLLAMLSQAQTNSASIGPSNHPPLIVAHRGASGDAPENTLAAFTLAWEQGADAIEGDFHLTRDRKVVCIHDKDTSRVSHKKLTVRKTRLADLQALEVGSWYDPQFSAQRIPTLAQVLETVPPTKKIYIELKSSPRIVRPLLKALDASPLASEQVVVISFSPRVVKKIKRLRPSLTVNLLSGIRRRDKDPRLEPNADTLIAKLRRCHADGLGIYAHPDLDDDFARQILDAGYPLHVWTVDDPYVAKMWSDRGVSSITTNHPRRIAAARP